MTAPRIRLVAAEAYQRPTPFRFPFRFGTARVTAAPQAFLRLRIEDASGRSASGWAAEMMMPKWFDKRPELSPEDNIADLRRSLRLAMAAMAAAGQGTAFDLHAAVEPGHHRACAAEGLPPLVASYGLALVDRAMLDALGRMLGLSVAELLRRNLPGVSAATAPDLAGFDLDGFLAGLAPAQAIAVRHTVGLADALTAEDLPPEARLNDGLPETLAEVIAACGHRHFKLKVSGDPQADAARLARIAAVLDAGAGGYEVTLDGNEQFASPAAVADLLDRIDADPALARLRRAIRFLEQPLPRAVTADTPIHALAARLPVEIDESDGDIAAFPAARALGYAGVSAKSCKGFYRAILNRARVETWNAATPGAPYFMSAEDLTTQGGLALQQDLALAALVGADSVERNGHHYVDGMAGAPAAEQRAFLAAHGDLYRDDAGRARLAIRDGAVALGSVLAAPGLGSAVAPDAAAMIPMTEPAETT